MASYYWIKLYLDILDDPKMGRLSNRLFRRTIECFLLAGEHNQKGLLPPLPDIAWRLRLSEEEVESDLIELQRVGIISHDNGSWHVANFEKRQSEVKPAERMRRMRERRRQEKYDERGPGYMALEKGDTPTGTGGLRDGDDDVTLRNADKDIDSDIDKKRESSSAGARTRARGEMMQAYEKGIGPLTAMIAERLNDLADDAEKHRLGLSEGVPGGDLRGEYWIIEAIKITSGSARRPSFRYAQAIVDRWIAEGYQSDVGGEPSGRQTLEEWAKEESDGQS